MDPKQSILLERRSNAVAAVVARVNDIPMRTLFGWLARHRAGGRAAPLDRPRSGRPRKATPEVRPGCAGPSPKTIPAATGSSSASGRWRSSGACSKGKGAWS